MDFKTYLNACAKKTALQINNYFTILKEDVHATASRLDPLVKIFNYHIFGGKMLRASLVKLGFDLTSFKPNPQIFKISAAIEILHTSLLIHDDIIDQSLLRRNKPSLYQKLGRGHYGLSQAICLGDLGFFLACKIISQTNFKTDQKNKAITYLTQVINNTIVGEMLDIELASSKETRLEKDVLVIHKLKTAYYSIVAPLTLGAMLANAKQSLLAKIESFGENLGIAYQIQDDILGCFGDEIKLGKSTHSDIEEGKNTLLITYALQKANPLQTQILEKFYGQGLISQKNYLQILQVFQETGALKYSQKKAQEYVAIAKKIIPQLTANQNLQLLFNQLTDLILQRKN